MKPRFVFAVLGALALGSLSLVGCQTGGASGNPKAGDANDPKSPDGKPAGKLTELKIEDKKVGTGPALANGDAAYVLYAGTLANGKEFDSNMTAKYPFVVIVGTGGVIKGWDQGLLGMKKGGRRRLSVPAELGYGSVPSEKIPANSDLFFDLELLDIVKSGELDIVDKTDLQVGTGAVAEKGDKVSITYKAYSPTEQTFEEQKDREVTLGPAGNIKLPGLDFGIVGMKVGGKRKIRIPPAVGYGPGGDPSYGIPANMVVTFEVELKKIVQKKAVPSG
ncbi:MAG: FKBP-type peptidyl-prolyl cis-trans isomerase [Fimbriimonadaceae bacterium]|nr:FKBP-type peptidyl-prolyl cis-trans isomerase [Fimbriimonadaceae bacterium]